MTDQTKSTTTASHKSARIAKRQKDISEDEEEHIQIVPAKKTAKAIKDNLKKVITKMTMEEAQEIKELLLKQKKKKSDKTDIPQDKSQEEIIDYENAKSIHVHLRNIQVENLVLFTRLLPKYNDIANRFQEICHYEDTLAQVYVDEEDKEHAKKNLEYLHEKDKKGNALFQNIYNEWRTRNGNIEILEQEYRNAILQYQEKYKKEYPFLDLPIPMLPEEDTPTYFKRLTTSPKQ
jgi:hypothetical protein